MITAHRDESSFVIIFTSRRRSYRKPDYSRNVRLLRVRVNLVFKRDAPLKASGWCAKRGPRIGIRVLKLVVIFDYGEARSAAFSESG